MTNTEFIQATSRLENYFDKEYKAEQQKEMFSMFREWSKERYIQAISYCIRNCKYLPKIVDLVNAEIGTGRIQETKKIDFVKCDKCNGGGFIKYFRKIKDGDRTIEYEYIALCTCENADKQRQINGYNLPTLAEIGL